MSLGYPAQEQLSASSLAHLVCCLFVFFICFVMVFLVPCYVDCVRLSRRSQLCAPHKDIFPGSLSFAKVSRSRSLHFWASGIDTPRLACMCIMLYSLALTRSVIFSLRGSVFMYAFLQFACLLTVSPLLTRCQLSRQSLVTLGLLIS